MVAQDICYLNDDDDDDDDDGTMVLVRDICMQVICIICYLNVTSRHLLLIVASYKYKHSTQVITCDSYAWKC